jgi:hypothetical protein
MPIGFKRANKQKHIFLSSIMHSERHHKKQYSRDCMDDPNIIIEKRNRESVKNKYLVNRDTNTKKKFQIERQLARDSKL